MITKSMNKEEYREWADRWRPRFAFLPTTVGFDESGRWVWAWWQWYEARRPFCPLLPICDEKRLVGVTVGNFVESVHAPYN